MRAILSLPVFKGFIMSSSYTSIFDGPTIITRKDLCAVLNLDMSRPDLKFSEAEIKKAYKIRALRFHPDSQLRFATPIPTESCNVLVNDIVLARDYMLEGKDNIPGKAFVEKSQNFAGTDSLAMIIGALNALKAGATTLAFAVPWLSRFSNNYLMIGLMSTFLNGQLNLRYINLLSKPLAAIRPLLQDVDGSTAVDFLRRLKSALTANDNLDLENLINELKTKLPKSMTEHPQFDTLLVTIKETGTELNKLLDDAFIDHVQHILKFWPQFIVNVPSWKHIIGVYFTSLIITSSNALHSLNALKVITEIILEQKGILALVLTVLPLTLLSAVMLPLSILSQALKQLAWIALKAAYQVLVNGFSLLVSVINLLRSFSADSDLSFSREAVVLLESMFNLTVRLSINILIGGLDAAIYVFTSKSPLSFLLDSINTAFDALFNHLRPESGFIKIEADARALDRIPAPDSAQEPLPAATQEPPAFAFFTNPNLSLHNQEDVWLNQLLASFAHENRDDKDAQTSPMMM